LFLGKQLGDGLPLRGVAFGGQQPSLVLDVEPSNIPWRVHGQLFPSQNDGSPGQLFRPHHGSEL
jgi:hypothetical protein